MKIRSAMVAGLLLGVAGHALAGPSPKAKPFEFVGTAAQCAPSPAGTDTVTGEWRSGIGLPDVGASNHGLFLQKLGATTNCASAGASIDGVAGIMLSELGFDIRNDSHCSGGAPRFNVDASDGFHFVGGCANDTAPAPGVPAAGWTRIRFDPSNPAEAFPPIAPGATVNSISVLFDEGQDTPVANAGTAVIDNIDINGVLIGKPGNVK